MNSTNPTFIAGSTVTESHMNNLRDAVNSKADYLELLPSAIASGAGTEGSPYTHADNTGGVQTQINALAAGRGGAVKLAAGRFNITTPITVTTPNIKVESVIAGYNIDPDALSQGISGSSLIVSGAGGLYLSGTGVSRVGGVVLSALYLYCNTALQSIGASTGTVGVKLGSYLDQPLLKNLNFGGFDYAIRIANTGGFLDLAYFDKINILSGRIGVYYDSASSYYQKWIHSCIADTKEHNFYVASSSSNEFFEIIACSFVRGSSAAGVTNPCNVYFGGTYGKFIGCTFVGAGTDYIGGTQRPADGIIIAGDNNVISGCSFNDCVGTGSAAIRINGNNNEVSSCVFNNNTTNIIINGNNNKISVFDTSKVTDNGTGNVINDASLATTILTYDGTTLTSPAPFKVASANDLSLRANFIIKTLTGGKYGAALDIDASALTGGKVWRFFSTAGAAGEGQGKLLCEIVTGLVAFAIDGTTGNMALGGITSPNALAVLDMSVNNRVLLPPKGTTTQKNALASPPEGSEFYDTTLHKKCVFTGSVWETITSS